MKTVKILEGLALLFFGSAPNFATIQGIETLESSEHSISNHLSDTSNGELCNLNTSTVQIEATENIESPISNRLHLKLSNFKTQNPQFDYGITSIGKLYDNNISIDEFYSSKQSNPILRKTLSVLEFSAATAMGVLRYLNVFHPKITEFSQALAGCSVSKLILEVVSKCFDKSTKQNDIILIDGADPTNPGLTEQILAPINEVYDIDIAPVLNISQKIIKTAKSKNILEEDILKLERLKNLINKIIKEPKNKKRILHGGRFLQFMLDFSMFLSLEYTDSSSKPYYWLTLINCSINPIIDYALSGVTLKQPKFQRYITISEIIYLCDELTKDRIPIV